MKKVSVLTLAALATAAACSENPAGMTADDIGFDQFVLTQGIDAPAPIRAMPGPRFSKLESAQLSLGGSSTTPISLNGAGCTTATPVPITITYTLTGNQASAASFKVNTVWAYDGSSFEGSTPTTVNLPAKQGGGSETYQVNISVSNPSGNGAGTTHFVVDPFDLDTDTNDSPGQQLSFEATSSATVHVDFVDCTPTAPANTAPSITVSADLTAEATSSAGATVTYVVSASDNEDGDLTASVICAPASGSVFPLGPTTVNCSVTDSGGLMASDSFDITVKDTTAPVFTAFPGNASLVAANINGLALDLSQFTITAEDKGPGGEAGHVSGPVSVACTIGGQAADGYQIGLGQTATVSCKATDSSTHPSPNTSADSIFTVYVGLDLSSVGGFLTPLRNSAPYSAHKRNSAIPHKLLAPKYADGSLATDLAAGLKLTVVNLGATGQTFDTETTDLSAGSTEWRWDALAGHYIFNAKTGPAWAEGTWETTVSYAGIVLAKTEFALKR